jgi:hypothetical protein
MRFDQTTTLKEFANFQLGQYQDLRQGTSLLEDMSALRMDVTTPLAIWQELKTGDWTTTKITEKKLFCN